MAFLLLLNDRERISGILFWHKYRVVKGGECGGVNRGEMLPCGKWVGGT